MEQGNATRKYSDDNVSQAGREINLEGLKTNVAPLFDVTREPPSQSWSKYYIRMPDQTVDLLCSFVPTLLLDPGLGR